MRSNDFLKEQIKIIEEHNKEFNRLRINNQKKHRKIQSSINNKMNEFQNNQKKRSADFNLIRNKQL